MKQTVIAYACGVKHLWIIAPTALLAICFACTSSPAQTAPPADSATSRSIEVEVLDNLKAQPVGELATVDDYQLPDAFLRVVADRVIRSSFEDQFRLVVRDQSSGSAASGGATQPAHSRTIRWLGLIILMPVAIAGWVLMARRKKANS